MEKNGNNIVDFQNPFNNLYFLDYETDSNFLEWYTLEGSERINELSRQLRTFLNYKSSIICLRFSGSQNHNQIIKNDNIIKQESELFSLSSRFTSLLKKIGVEEGGISEKIQTFIDKVKTQPKNLEIKLLKEIKMISSKIWKTLHILSEMELQNYYKLLNITIKLASILCNIEAVFFTTFSDFYSELKHNYLQLEKELSILLCLNEDEQFETKKKKKQVRILE
jgi:hypothetical protein